MRGTRLSLHVVHLFHQGSYVRTLPRPFSHAAAMAYVASYNRLGQADGRTAALVTLQAELCAAEICASDEGNCTPPRPECSS